jgi:hypothetical protein
VKHSLITKFLLAGLYIAVPCSLFAASFEVTDDFLAHMKRVINPHDFGLKSDGRFYPYTSPKGWLIGYEKPVTDKSLHKKGWSREEAEAILREDIDKAVAELVDCLSKTHPAKPFDSLRRKSREMLVDHAVTEGAANIPPAFYEAVIKEDWDGLFKNFIYIRWVEPSWPDVPKNKAFIDRWMDMKDRQRPSQPVCARDE